MYKLFISLALALSSFACSSPELKQIPVPDKVGMVAKGEIKLPEGALFSTNDTICGMAVGNQPADTLTYEGKLFGFCSEGCKNDFIAEHKLK